MRQPFRSSCSIIIIKCRMLWWSKWLHPVIFHVLKWKYRFLLHSSVFSFLLHVISQSFSYFPVSLICHTWRVLVVFSFVWENKKCEREQSAKFNMPKLSGVEHSLLSCRYYQSLTIIITCNSSCTSYQMKGWKFFQIFMKNLYRWFIYLWL